MISNAFLVETANWTLYFAIGSAWRCRFTTLRTSVFDANHHLQWCWWQLGILALCATRYPSGRTWKLQRTTRDPGRKKHDVHNRCLYTNTSIFECHFKSFPSTLSELKQLKRGADVLGLWPLGSRFLVLTRPGRTEVLRVDSRDGNLGGNQKFVRYGFMTYIYIYIYM